jgi:hypothetical protein
MQPATPAAAEAGPAGSTPAREQQLRAAAVSGTVSSAKALQKKNLQASYR